MGWKDKLPIIHEMPREQHAHNPVWVGVDRFRNSLLQLFPTSHLWILQLLAYIQVVRVSILSAPSETICQLSYPPQHTHIQPVPKLFHPNNNSNPLSCTQGVNNGQTQQETFIKTRMAVQSVG